MNYLVKSRDARYKLVNLLYDLRFRNSHFQKKIFFLKKFVHGSLGGCFGKNMAKPSSALLERSFSVLSHLHCQQKSSYMKIQVDGSLIDIDVSLLEPDTE